MIVEKTDNYTVYKDRQGYCTVAVRTRGGTLWARKRKNESVDEVVDKLGNYRNSITLTEEELFDLVRAAILLHRSAPVRHGLHLSAIVSKAVKSARRFAASVDESMELDGKSTVKDLLDSYCSWVDSSPTKTEQSKQSQKSRARSALRRLCVDLGENAYRFVSGTELPEPSGKNAGTRAILLYGRNKFKLQENTTQAAREARSSEIPGKEDME